MTRVLVLARVPFVAEALGRALTEEGLHVTDVLFRPADAVAAAVNRPPDVALVDVGGGVEPLKEVANAINGARLVALGVREVEGDVLACIEAGAVGYVPTEASLDDVVHRVRRVARGKPLVSPQIVASLMRRVAALSANGARLGLDALTNRELEVLHLIERGRSNKEIAAHLSIGVTTVKNHVHSILEKLSVRRRGEAAALVRAVGAGGGIAAAHGRAEASDGALVRTF